MPVLIDNKKKDSDLHNTLFGFPTKNAFASKTLNFVYVIVMVVAVAFAFHALGLILSDWNKLLVFLAAIAVVGLPYCIKIIMYGKEVFEYKMAVLCILISLLPTIFDFVGFYSETSIKSALQKTKFEVLETVNYFDKDARQVINKELLVLENDLIKKSTSVEQNFNTQMRLLNENILKEQSELEKKYNSQLKNLNEKVNIAQQSILDETQGVRGKGTSGVAGNGPRAIELEAELRKTKSSVDIERNELDKNKQKEMEKIINSFDQQKNELESNKQREIDALKKEYEKKKETFQQSLDAINNLMSTSENGSGLIFEVNKAKSFNELADVSVKVNNAINIVGSKIKTEPKFIKFESDNVIELSFGALFRGDITAIICFLLAALLEIVDTIIVYMVRGVRPDKRKKYEEPINNLRERIYY